MKRPDKYPTGTREHVLRNGSNCTYCRIPVHFDYHRDIEGQWWTYPANSGTAEKQPPPGVIWERATVDHVVPLAQGGTHTLDNFALACLPCKSRKNARTPDECAVAS